MTDFCERVTGQLSYRQAAAALFDVTVALAADGETPGLARMLRWRNGYAVFVCGEGVAPEVVRAPQRRSRRLPAPGTRDRPAGAA